MANYFFPCWNCFDSFPFCFPFHSPPVTERTKGQARDSPHLCVPAGSPVGSRGFCHPLQPLHTQPQGKSHIPSPAQAAEDQKWLFLTQGGASTSPLSCLGLGARNVLHKQITCVCLTGSLGAESHLRHGTWGGSGGTGAGGETAAASDPEDCEEAKYGWLPEQMLSLLGNCSEVCWKSQRTKRCRKAPGVPDLQESPWPWAGSSNLWYQLAHCCPALLSQLWLWALSPKPLDFWSPGAWSITKMNGKKGKRSLKIAAALWVSLCGLPFGAGMSSLQGT